MVDVNRTPFNTIPKKWAFDKDVYPFILELLREVEQLRERVGGDNDLVTTTNNASNLAFQLPRDTNSELSDAVEIALAENKAEQALSQLSELAKAIQAINVGPQPEHHNKVETEYIDFSRYSNVPTDHQGVLYWNEDDGTLDISLLNGSILQTGQEIHFYAKNTSGAQIDNGTPVMFTGTVGASGKLTCAPAVADGTYPSNYMMGVATQDIANNDFGYITHFGLVRGLVTDGSPYSETWNDGDLLYFDPATAGTWTKVQPTADNIKNAVAVVVYATSGASGSIFVRMNINETLAGLQDVELTSITNHDLIAYNSTNSRFENTDTPYVEGIVIEKTAGLGIKLEKASPTFGWEDMLSEVATRGVGATDPNWSVYRNGIYQYLFSVNDESWHNFHILHDYAPGTDFFIHCHWSHNSAAVTTGSVTWSLELTYAKGHNQAAFPATVTLTITQTASTTQYQHMIAEGQASVSGGSATQLDSDDFEVDGLLLVRCYLSANTMDGGALPFLHFVDIHYQSTGIKTKDKAPNFYT